MSKVQLQGNVSGTGIFTIASPNSNIDRTLSLPDNTGTLITQNSQPSFASTIGVGGATPSASGAGITFPATQSASSDANTLDDYEEGTWTPIDSSGAGLTLAAANGRYVKIGRLVQIWFRAQYPTTSNTSAALIGGLPFTGAGASGSFDVAGGWNQFFAQNLNATYEGYINVNTTTLTVYNMISNQTTALTNANISTVNLYAYGFYYANA